MPKKKESPPQKNDEDFSHLDRIDLIGGNGRQGGGKFRGGVCVGVCFLDDDPGRYADPYFFEPS